MNEKTKNIYIPSISINKILKKNEEVKKLKSLLEKYGKDDDNNDNNIDNNNIDNNNNNDENNDNNEKIDYELKISNLKLSDCLKNLNNKLPIVELPYISRSEQVKKNIY
jgi:hypothetical protein